MNKLQWQIEPISYNIEQLWVDWQALFVNCHDHNPMLDTRFIQPLFHYFPANVFIVRGIIKNQIAAILLLEKSTFGSWKNYMPSQSQLALVLVKTSVDFNFKELMASLGGGIFKLDIFSLDPQEHSSIINDVKQPEVYAQNITLQIDSSFEDYWRARPKRLRKDISKNLNRLAKDKIEVVHKTIDEPYQIKLAVDRYGMLESQGWKGKSGTAIHPANTQGQFYRALLDGFAQNRQAQVFESYIEQKLVASRLCVFNKDTLIILKTTFDEEYSYYALGNLNRFKLIESLFEYKKSKCVDFYTNASKEQLYWSTEQRSMYNATCYRNAFIEGAATVTKQAKRWLKLVK